MPMTVAERRNLNALLSQLLVDEIHGQFLDLYAAAVSLTEKHPEQVNNELRNAMTHLSRAAAMDDFLPAQAEIAKAVAHIERAKRDAVKVAVIALRDLIADASADIKLLNGTVDPGFIVRRDEVAKKRKQLLKQESQGAPVLNGFVQLYLEADELHDDLVGVLATAGRRRGRWFYRFLSWRKAGLGFVVGILVAVLGRMLFSVIAPDPTAFGNGVRQRVGVDAQPPPINSHAASSPSTGATPGAQEPRP